MYSILTLVLVFIGQRLHLRYLNFKMDDLIKNLVSKLPFEKNNTQSFYDFVKTSFNLYNQELSKVDAQLFGTFLEESNEMRCEPTKERFINLIKRIESNCLDILCAAYKGDLFYSIKLLRRLLKHAKYTDYKLKDELLGYFSFTFKDKDDAILYRCVDYNGDDNTKDCYHLPYELRYKASKNRFNQLGVICMYLSSSPKKAIKEAGKKEKGKERWLGSFKMNRKAIFLNFKIPSFEEIDRMTSYDKFAFLIKYPFMILCLTKDKDKQSNTFCDSYLFSQVFFHNIFLNIGKDENVFFDGIIYSSMEDCNEYNIVIPAKYNIKEPPNMGHSEFVKQLIGVVSPPSRIK